VGLAVPFIGEGIDHAQEEFEFSERFMTVAVCCSVLQCLAVCCIVLQCVAVCCSVLQCLHVRTGGVQVLRKVHDTFLDFQIIP